MSEGIDPKKANQIAHIEKNLLDLNQSKDKYKTELERIPDNAKTIAQRRRREFLESELKLIGKNLGILKGKLKDLGELGTGATFNY